ncbi:unnamed protein product [Musa hybrid cultivar]
MLGFISAAFDVSKFDFYWLKIKFSVEYPSFCCSFSESGSIRSLIAILYISLRSTHLFLYRHESENFLFFQLVDCSSICHGTVQELGFAEEQIRLSDALFEISQGQWEGCLRSEVYSPEMVNLIDRTQPDFCAPSGESLRQVVFRMVEFLNRTVLRLPEKLAVTDTSIHQNESKALSRNSSSNSVQDRDGPHWDLLYRLNRPSLQRKKSGKSRLQFVTTGDNETDEEFSPREVTPGNLLPDGSRNPIISIGIFTHAIPIKCLLTGLLDCSPAICFSSPICHSQVYHSKSSVVLDRREVKTSSEDEVAAENVSRPEASGPRGQGGEEAASRPDESGGTCPEHPGRTGPPDLQDLKSCYDSILSAAATTANNAHEFSEALEELGTCFLEKTALNDDEDSGRALMMMGKAQFKLQKLFDVYRVHILQTMEKPSRSLLRELQVVEEMKRLCDAKREIYRNSLEAHRGKWMLRYSKSGTFSSKELQEAQANYEEEENMFMFRLKSLKKGQFQSLLTQATRHHAAQLTFFKKGLKMLEMVESHVKAIAERHHIAYQFSDLEDDVSDYDDDDDDYDYGGSDVGELSFDYKKNFQGKNVIYTSQNSIEESIDRSQLDMLSFSCRPGYSSQSAPIFADKKLDLTEKTETPPLSTRKFHSYVLPTPVGDRNPESNPGTAPCVEKNDSSPPLWNSSPLEAKRPVKDFRERELSSPTTFKNSVLRGSNINSGPISMPSYFSEKPSMPQINQKTAYDTNNFRRQAFSGPLTSKCFSSKPIVSAPDYRSSVEFPPVGSSASQHVFKPQSSPPHKETHRTSPPPVSYPKISELHELPRPPVGSEKSTGASTLIGYSGPLVSRSKVLNARNNMPSDVSYKTLLPAPFVHISRSFSIPSNSQRISMLTAARLLESPHNLVTVEEITSSPLAI